MTSRQATLWAATLVPVSELPFLLGMSGAAYGLAALVLGFALFGVAARFLQLRTNDAARALFYGSITYLPLLWILMGVART
jgi:protoheme IX farnesyltransferase